MEPDEKLDLCGILDPYCLLACKSVLASLKPGAVLEVSLDDPQAVEDLVTIVERAGDGILEKEKLGERYRLLVRKGALR